MKKSQIETIGLVVIVVLIAFILIFVLQISNKPSNTNLNDRYLQLNADNLRSTLLKTNLCNNVNVRDEILTCNQNSFTTCNNINCNELNNIIKKIIEDSLNVTRNYKFEVGNILLEKGSCKNVYAASSEPIPYSNLKITFEIC